MKISKKNQALAYDLSGWNITDVLPIAVELQKRDDKIRELRKDVAHWKAVYELRDASKP